MKIRSALLKKWYKNKKKVFLSSNKVLS
jgi:hypothetical protein